MKPLDYTSTPAKNLYQVERVLPHDFYGQWSPHGLLVLHDAPLKLTRVIRALLKGNLYAFDDMLDDILWQDGAILVGNTPDSRELISVQDDRPWAEVPAEQRIAFERAKLRGDLYRTILHSYNKLFAASRHSLEMRMRNLLLESGLKERIEIYRKRIEALKWMQDGLLDLPPDMILRMEEEGHFFKNGGEGLILLEQALLQPK